MTDLLELQYALESQAEKMLSLAKMAKEGHLLLHRATSTDVVQQLLEADENVQQLKIEVVSLEEKLKNLREEFDAQSKNMRKIRTALNGRGKNPMSEHALAVFQSLKEACPSHPLVQELTDEKA